MKLETFEKDFNQLKSQHIQDRKNHLAKYEHRLDKIQSRFNKQSIDLEIHLHRSKKLLKTFTLNMDDKFNRNFVLVDISDDVPISSDLNVLNFTFTKLSELKDTKKRTFKQLLKRYAFIIRSQNAAKILKTFGKLFQKYNNVPIVVSEKLKSLSTLQKTSFKVEDSKVIRKKIGDMRDSPELIADRIKTILNHLDLQNQKVKYVLVKTTRSSNLRYNVQ
jgi:hypothetical protein